MHSTHTPADPCLTIVPDDAHVEADVLDTVVDVTDEAERRVRHAPLLPDEPFSIAPAAKREAAPRRPTSKLVVAGAVGGGMVLGGGVMAAIGLVVLLGLGAIGAVGGVTWMSAAPAAVEAPVASPVDELAADQGVPAGEDEAPEEMVDGPAAPPSEAAPEPEDAAPEAAPAAPTPAPTPAPAAPPPVAPAVPATAPGDEVPADDILVKLLSDPPAASVTIDGRSMGRTPLRAFLSPGDHTVVIESGKASGQFSIDPMSDERVCFKAKGRKVQLSSCK